MRAFPALGFDPCPGAPATVRDIAGTLRRSGDAMVRAADILRGQDCRWRGEAAEAFRERVGVRAPEQLLRAEQSFLAAGSALTGWADLLEDHQRQADVLEARAADLVRRVETLQHQTDSLAWEAQSLGAYVRLTGAAPPLSAWSSPDPRVERAGQVDRELAVSRARLSQVEAELVHERSEAERLRTATVQAAAVTARALLVAQGLAPLGPGLLGQAAGAIGDAASAGWDWCVAPYAQLAADTMGFLKQHQDALAFVSDLTGMLSSVLSILALIPLCQPLAVPALVLGGVSALSAYGAAVGAQGSWSGGLTKDVWVGAGTTLAGLGALGTAAQLGKAAKGGAFTSTDRTIFGSRSERPLGTLGVLRRGAAPMEDAEAGWRVVDVFVGGGARVMNGVAVDGGFTPGPDGRSPWGERQEDLVRGRSGVFDR